MQTLFIGRGGGFLLALRPTHPKKILTQTLAKGKSNLNKRPLYGTHPDHPPPLVSIPYKQGLVGWGWEKAKGHPAVMTDRRMTPCVHSQ